MATADTGIFVNLEFERGILQLASLTGHRNIHQLVEAFNRWHQSTVLPWQVALDYCIDRARAGKSLPWEWKGHHASQVIIDEADEFFQIVGDDVQLVGNPPELQMSESVDWTSDNPTEPGWYATVHCWDPNEGMFPGAHYWDGGHWQPRTSASIQHWRRIFETEQEAKDYAWEHDPER